MASVTAPPILNTFKRNWKIAPVDANGNPVTVTATWALTSDPALGTIVPAADNLSAFVVPAPGAVGNITFTVTDGTLTDDGIQPVEAAPPTAVALNLSFDAEVPQP